jgi:hypothetical protein
LAERLSGVIQDDLHTLGRLHFRDGSNLVQGSRTKHRNLKGWE